MKIKDELETLIKPYQHQTIFSPLQREQLEKQFIQLIDKALIENGTDKATIETTARKLSILFHPDRGMLTASVAWMENTLGNYSATDKPFSKAICFNIFSLCKDAYLNTDEQYQDYTFHMFKTFCVTRKATATTLIQSLFYDSCLTMLNQIEQYHQTVDLAHCRPCVNFSQKMFPVVVSSSVSILLAHEMLAFYGMCFFYNRLGIMMKNNAPNRPCQFFGQSMASITGNMMMLTATSFMKIHTLTTAMCNNNLAGVIAQFEYVKAAVQQMLPFRMIKSLLPYSEKKSILALTRYEFRSPHLEKIVQPLKGYLIEADRQCLKSLRCGQQKSDAVKDFFYDLMVLESQESLKPKTVWDLLNNLALTDVIQHKGEVQKALLASRELFFSYYQLQPALEEPSMNNGAYSFN